MSFKTCLWQLGSAQETGRLKPNCWSFSREIDIFWFASFGFAAVMCQLPEQLLQGMQAKRRTLADEEVKIQQRRTCISLLTKVCISLYYSDT